MGGVFISYRRDDSRGSAGRLYDNLSDRFGPEVIFRDLDALRPGAVYGNVIHTAIAGCDALIAVIGSNWLEARDREGRRRLDNKADLVRTEIATALAQNKIVVPVLVEDAKMPSEPDLPPDLAALASRNALLISDQRWEYDVKRLMDLLEDVVGRPAGPAHSVALPPVATPPVVIPPAEPPVPAATVAAPAVKRKRPIVQLALLVMALVAAGSFVAGRRSITAPSAETEVATGGERVFPPRPEIQEALPEIVTPSSVPATEPPKGTIPIKIGDTVAPDSPPGAGNIASPGTRQRYTFAAAAGQIIYLKTTYTGPAGDLRWKLFAPSGTEIGYESMGYNIGRVRLPANGTYTVEVSGSGSGTGTYGFVVLAVPADVTFAISIGDSIQNGTPAGAGNIASPGTKQRFTFAGAAGQVVYLKTSYKGPAGDLRWKLFSPSDTEIGYESMGYDIGRVTLPANGTYTIEVSGTGTGIGVYGFALTAA
jgi:hypothetical protein